MIIEIPDRFILRDIIAEALEIKPTEYMIDTVIVVLPQDILALATQWGFRDTVVRDSIFEFLVEHKEEALKQFAPIPTKRQIWGDTVSQKTLCNFWDKNRDRVLLKLLSAPKFSPSETK